MASEAEELWVHDPYTGWRVEDCGCCAGIEWGGEYPRECRDCNGTGVLWLHKKSGVLAEYPGGRFLGRRKPENVEEAT